MKGGEKVENNLIVMDKGLTPYQPAESQWQSETEDAGPTMRKSRSFKVEGGELFKVIGNKTNIIANFYLRIVSRSVIIDEEVIIDQLLDLEIHFRSDIKSIRVRSNEFQSGNFMPKIWAEVGPRAILYGSRKDLVVATQEISDDVLERRVLTCGGFYADGCFYGPGLRITPAGIFRFENRDVDLSGGIFSRHIGFSHSNATDISSVANHIYQDFLNLKGHDVTYPLMGHICLAPFSSFISEEMGRKKSALHLEGPSGGGKTMLASLAMSFFGDFQDHFMPWTSTANAIEREGYFFRDSLFLVDDLKASIVASETVIRILQNYVDGHGRARMSSNAKLQDPSYIRGLLLSTGEDFVDDIESIKGRTIILNVEPQKNTEAGMRCLENRRLYRSFMPGLIQEVISGPAWKEEFQAIVNDKINEFHQLTSDLPNGLRISSNWALNYLGFYIFAKYINNIGIIDDSEVDALLAEYMEIAARHIQCQTEELVQDDPVTILFRILQQKLQAGQVSVLNLSGTTSGRGRVVGIAQEAQGVVHLHPDLVMEMLGAHFRMVPFSKKALTKALARQGFIVLSETGRWTRQVRDQIGERTRSNVWEMELNRFKENCGIAGS